jgi:hypothetical protein
MSPEKVSNLPGDVGKHAVKFEKALDGTLYWTLSIYIDADAVKDALGHYLDPELCRSKQLGHQASWKIASAIDPLFNDIADRDRLGKVEDFLFAAGIGHLPDNSDVDAIVRSPLAIRFHLPEKISWRTEGEQFECRFPPEEIASVGRLVSLRRFWFAHTNGALSYHLSFAYRFATQVEAAEKADAGADEGSESTKRDAATYYFLSLLQKLAVPKEFSLHESRLAELKPGGSPCLTVFDDKTLGIDPLDSVLVSTQPRERKRFWPYVRELFESDALVLFRDVFEAPGLEVASVHSSKIVNLMDSTLIDLIEVPGLRVPRSRSLFFIQDERFFKRLLPQDAEGRPLARKRLVQDPCYLPYAEKLKQAKGDDGARYIGIGEPSVSWEWLNRRDDYRDLLGYRDLKTGRPVFSLDPDGANPVKTMDALVAAIRAGKCWQHMGPSKRFDLEVMKTPLLLDIPSFDVGRTDCLDYLFLAGFNQNIIDWLNQEPSEILDSTDPIYPKEASQYEEAFFVRFANHRAMTTYVRKSRTLEVGNDYIGTCPYAFLIHVLAMHNEFLASKHERSTAQAIQEIRGKIKTDFKDSQAKPAVEKFRKIEEDINNLKYDHYEKFERHRFGNIFRYDTERDVFEAIEQLRGMGRRDAALREAIHSLEDHSQDLEARFALNRRENEESQEKAKKEQSEHLSRIVTIIGLVSGSSVLFSIADFLEKLHWSRTALSIRFVVMGLVVGGISWAIRVYCTKKLKK